MTEKEEGEHQPIAPPEQNKTRDVGRAVVEGLVDLVPGGGVVTGVARVLAPSQSDKNQENWQSEISERSNEHDARLDQHDEMLAPTETLTGLPAAVVKWLIEDCPDGLGQKFFEPSDVKTQFPEEDEDAIDDAMAELELFGLVKVRHHFSGWHASLTPEAYEQLDHQLMGWDTIKDAVSVAELMLDLKTGNAPLLHEKTTWDRRRFNPAFQYLLRFFPKGRIRQVIQPDYPSLGVLIEPEDRVKLRRFIAAHRED